MKNRIKISLAALISSVLIGGGLYVGRDSLAPLWNRTKEITVTTAENLLQSAQQKLRNEPQEVTALRNMDVADSEDGYTEYYFHILTEEEQRIYRKMLSGIRSGEESFYLTTTDQDMISHVYQAVVNDHAELYRVKNRLSKTTTTTQGTDYCEFSPGYSYTDEECLLIDSAVENAYQTVLAMIPEGASDYEKVQIVYTYLIDHTEYQDGEDDQNIAGVFWKNAAVCAGYASAMQYLLDRLDIPSIYVTGDIENSDAGHAWNIVTLDGDYYIVDATNGDQPEFLEGDAVQLAEHKTTLYDYLCPFPEEYALNYTVSEEFVLPEVTSHDKNFYVLNQACFDTYDWQSVYDLCVLRINNNAAVVRFKFGTQEAFDAAYADWIEGDSARSVAQYYMQVNGMNYVEYHQGVLKELKTIYYIF